MNKWFRQCLVALMALMMFTTAAAAESATVEGTVVATQTVAILAPAAGTLSELTVTAGDRVTAGETAASLMTTRVYAEQAGTVRLFGQTGDSVETLTDRYGAVAYVEPDLLYTINASTRYAYDAAENKVIHPGETVYLLCTSSCAHTGVGRVTQVNGSSFTVEVTEGNFESGETVRVHRSETYTTASRIGRGSISVASPIACTGSGTVTKIYVADGAQVERGTLLYETVETNAYCDAIVAPVTGVVAEVSASAGDTLEQGTLLASIYPDDAMRLMVEADEYTLRKLTIGSKVSIEFTCGITAEGTIERIAGIQQAVDTTEEDTDEDEDALFAVYIQFLPTDTISYGMTAKITIMD
ncbi:MAG: HlyD family efflux transporter periplasmic adaptor subunit [Aristaeellaceae bacterium]